MHFALLYFMPVAFSKCISCVLRCATELLLPMYIVASSAKAEVFSSFSPITIPLMPLLCLIFSKNISANIMYRIIDNGYPCYIPLFTGKACGKCPFTLICVSMLWLTVFIFCIILDPYPVHPVKCFFLVKRHRCCLNLVSICIGHNVPIQLQVFNDSSLFY